MLINCPPNAHSDAWFTLHTKTNKRPEESGLN